MLHSTMSSEQDKELKTKNDFTENDIAKVKFIQRLWRLRSFFSKTDFNAPAYLNSISILLKSSNAPITAHPPKPEPQTIDKAKAEKFIAQFTSPSMQATARKVIEHHLQYISFEEFQTRLFDAMLKLNRFLLAKNINPNSLSVMIEKGHSSEWVASLAVKYLNFVPKNYYTVDCAQSWKMSSCFDFSKIQDKIHTLVIFDDWSISGTQLCQVLNQIHLAKEKAKQPFELHIVVVAPLMTRYAYRTNLEKFCKNENIFLKIITTAFMPSLQELQHALTKAEFADFNEMIGYERDAELHYPSPRYERLVLAFSDWKKLDYVSMPTQFTSGYIPWNLTPYEGKRFDEVPADANGNKFIPDVEPPYHKRNY